ncbi:hypothetical protein BCT06_01310 [Vibrio breoganii]|uniref:Flp family type IVb pilin n=1 Tax=Vibrio breoganii TaxID=553239 RepID=UPI000C853780|nr:hypothetical protein [Vibrio breoganii]PMO62647.1 hypothetical protein BCT06_01310 [Vibrio breoganii]
MDLQQRIESTSGFFRDEEGLTVVEYVIGAAVLVSALVLVFAAFGNGLSESLGTTMGNLPSVDD